MSTFIDLLRPLLDPKFIVTLALIVCATWLAHARVIDGAAWLGMCAVTGAAYGAGGTLAEVTRAYAREVARSLGGREN